MESKSKMRIAEIDIAKGINIILVIIGHLASFNGIVFREIFSFHMAFFFIMSGYCSPNGKSDNSPLDFIRKLTKDLLIPSLVVRVILTFYCNQMSFWDGLKNIFLLPSTEWFFTSLFIARLLFFYINRYLKNKKIIIYSVLGLLLPCLAKLYCAMGFHDSPTLIFPLDCSMIGLSFILIGSSLRKIQEAYNITTMHIFAYIKRNSLMLAISILIILFLVQYNDYVNISNLCLGKSDLLFYGLAVFGSFMILILSIWLNQIFSQSILLKAIKIFGRHTKIIYPAHIFLHMFYCYIILRITGKSFEPMINMPVALSLVFFVLDIIILSCALYLVESKPEAAKYKYVKYVGLLVIITGIMSVEAQLLDETYFSNILLITFMLLCAFMSFYMIIYKGAKLLPNIYIQLFIIFIAIAAFWDASIVNCLNNIRLVNHPIMILGFLLWNGSALGFGLRLYSLYKGIILKKAKVFLFDNLYLIILCIVILILNIPSLSYWFKSDSNIYYSDMIRNYGEWDFTIASALSCLSLGGHLCYGYSFFMIIGQCFFPDNGIGIRLISLILYLVTIFCFSKILDNLSPKLNRMENVLCTGIFAFTPIVFGILFEANIDFPLLCFFTWFIYCHLTGNKILRLFTGVLTCFSKEIGILFIVGFFVSNYIYKVIFNKGNRNIFQNIKYTTVHINLVEFLSCFICAFLFLICSIFTKEGWVSNPIMVSADTRGTLANSIQFSWHYILIKLKQLFVLNFQWLFLAVFLVFAIFLIIKKLKPQISQIGFTLFVLFLGSLCFNFFYFTWPHARYLQIETFFFSIFLAYMLKKMLGNTNLLAIILGTVLCIRIIGCYILIDPFSYMCFKNIMVGDKEIISLTEYATLPDSGTLMFSEKENDAVNLDNHIFRDFVQYNREYTNLEKLIEKTFKDIEYNESMAVCIPPLFSVWENATEEENTNYTLENLFGFNPENAYWDDSTNNIYYQLKREPNELSKINWLAVSEINKKSWKKYKKIVYFDFPYKTTWNKDIFFKHYNRENLIKEECNGWKLKVYYITPK